MVKDENKITKKRKLMDEERQLSEQEDVNRRRRKRRGTSRMKNIRTKRIILDM